MRNYFSQSIFILFFIFFSSLSFAKTGLFFKVITGRNFLKINTTIPHHAYSKAGIKLDSANQKIISGCTQINNGYCLFTVSDTQSATINVVGPEENLSGILCLNAMGPVSCQHYQNIKIKAEFTAVGYSNGAVGLVSSDQVPFSYYTLNKGESWLLSSTQPYSVNSNASAVSVSCNTLGMCAAVGSGNLTANSVSIPVSYVSNDGGINWASSTAQPQSPNTNNYMELDAVGCGVGHCTTVGVALDDSFNFFPYSYYSNDGGEHWFPSITQPEPKNSNTITGVACNDSGLGCTAVGYQNISNVSQPLFYFTQDGGKKWFTSTFSADSLTYYTIYNVTCGKNSSRCIAVGNLENGLGFQPAAFVSTNQGAQWSPSNTMPSSNGGQLYSVACNSTGLRCVAVGTYETNNTTQPICYLTNDGGVTWDLPISQPTYDEPNTRLRTVTCDETGLNCVAFGSANSLDKSLTFYTTDGGVHWQLSNPLPNPPPSVSGPSLVSSVN